MGWCPREAHRSAGEVGAAKGAPEGRGQGGQRNALGRAGGHGEGHAGGHLERAEARKVSSTDKKQWSRGRTGAGTVSAVQQEVPARASKSGFTSQACVRAHRKAARNCREVTVRQGGGGGGGGGGEGEVVW